MIRVLHDDLRGFINTRLETGGPDAEACYRILCRTSPNAPSTPNYFLAMPNPKDTAKAIISYSTDAAMDKHEVNRGSQRAVWNATGAHRTQMRVGRWARSLTDIEDGYALDALTMAMDGFFGVGEVKVELIEGKAPIANAYLERSHCRCVGIGDLAGSCMRYDHNNRYFDIYGIAAKLAVVKCPECDGIRARAVAWDDGTHKFIDRRYGTQQMKQAIVNFAQAEGYTDVWPGQVGAYAKKHYTLSFAAKREDLAAAPYLDSLFYWCRTCNTLSNKGEGCRDAKHDLAQLRGTHGTDHNGWWGRCQNCASSLSEQGICTHSRRCPGCDARYCGTNACPNGCVQCQSCGDYRRANVTTCPRGCIVCPDCRYGNRSSFLSQTHGKCGGCGKQLVTTVGKHEVKPTWTRTGEHLSFRCPEDECGWKIIGSTYSKDMGLVKCEHVHNGPYAEYSGGHCPSCHTYIELTDPGPKPAPKSGLPVFQKYTSTSTLPTNWVSTMSYTDYPGRRNR